MNPELYTDRTSQLRNQMRRRTAALVVFDAKGPQWWLQFTAVIGFVLGLAIVAGWVTAP